MARRWLFTGAVQGGFAVAAGAFGAHGLKDRLAATGREANWETAVQYAFWHALAILVVALAVHLARGDRERRLLAAAAGCFCLGTLIFSGCLAALALTGLRILGAIVPIGGLLFLVGWALLAAAAVRLGGATDP
jgi:uncharacterized membrane protein YgdD (TMEM256/DUF423 family)